MLGTTLCWVALTLAAEPEKTVAMRDFAGAGVQAVPVKVLKDDIAVKEGSTLTVNLESNPSTGYGWKVLGPDYGPLQLKKASYVRPMAAGRVGAAGTQVFEFTARTKNQQVVLVFVYGRPFEGLGEQCYQLRVKVEE